MNSLVRVAPNSLKMISIFSSFTDSRKAHNPATTTWIVDENNTIKVLTNINMREEHYEQERPRNKVTSKIKFTASC